jgi:hypothetical protein
LPSLCMRTCTGQHTTKHAHIMLLLHSPAQHATWGSERIVGWLLIIDALQMLCCILSCCAVCSPLEPLPVCPPPPPTQHTLIRNFGLSHFWMVPALAG